MSSNKTLIVIVGPTAVGKTSTAIAIAKKYNTEIISADSRQFYREIPIGTAAPSNKEMQLVKHHFIANLSVSDYYNVSMYEQEVLSLLEKSFATTNVMVMAGGSGLYIDAVCKGIDELPNVDEKLRSDLNNLFQKKGIIALQEKLLKLDPEYYKIVDLNNPKRLLRAIEVCLQTGKSYSSQRKDNLVKRPFNILKIGIEMPREQLIEQIDRRLNSMVTEGWIEEAKSVIKNRDCNALNTVGYKELFNYIDGIWSLEMAIEKIKVNTRRYAKRQMTWFKRDKGINWFTPNELKNIFKLIDSNILKL